MDEVLAVEQTKGVDGRKVNSLIAKTRVMLEDRPFLTGLDAAIEFLHQNGVSSEKLDDEISRYRSFLTKDTIPAHKIEKVAVVAR